MIGKEDSSSIKSKINQVTSTHKQLRLDVTRTDVNQYGRVPQQMHVTVSSSYLIILSSLLLW